MHPDIADYWKCKGKSITGWSSPSIDIYYEGTSFEGMAPPYRKSVLCIVYKSKEQPYIKNYFLQGEDSPVYTEEQMLKVIKLMAFI